MHDGKLFLINFSINNFWGFSFDLFGTQKVLHLTKCSRPTREQTYKPYFADENYKMTMTVNFV